MREADFSALQPWLDAGVGEPLEQEPDALLVRKHYLELVDGGYALTEKGYRQAQHRTALLDSPEGTEGEV